jgi:hypothetical protein
MTSRFMRMEQHQVQQTIDAASPEEIVALKLDAEDASAEFGFLVANGSASMATKNAFHLAIEVLVRLEAKEKRKGWLFRTKRRLQLTAMYLGG